MVTDPRRPLAPRQREMLQHIERLTRETGYPPSLSELGKAMGIKSSNGVAECLRTLRRKGYVTWHPFKSRTLRTLRPPPTEPLQASPPPPRREVILVLSEAAARQERAENPRATVVAPGPDGRWTFDLDGNPATASMDTTGTILVTMRASTPERGTP